MTVINPAKRSTGRTTRMLEDAWRKAAEGHNVVVGMATMPDIDNARLTVDKLMKASGLPSVHAEAVRDNIDICMYNTIQRKVVFSMDGFHLPYPMDKWILFVDHRALEVAHHALLDMLHRYDLPT